MRSKFFKISKTSFIVWEKFLHSLTIHLWWILKTILARLGLQKGEDDESTKNEKGHQGEGNYLSLVSCHLCNLKIFPKDIRWLWGGLNNNLLSKEFK